MSLLAEKIKNSEKSQSTDYSTISVRMPIEIASMVETMSIVAQSPIIDLFTDDLSLYLRDFLLQDSNNMDLIEGVLQENYKNLGNMLSLENSCLELLEQDKIINLTFTEDEDFLNFLGNLE